jgi:hypothetical protein
MRLQIAKILPLAFANFGFSMTQIRNEKQISIGELSHISGLPEAVLEAAEASTVDMTDEDSREVKRVYWSLAALEATPDDYKLLLKKIAVDSGGE